jgi:hypothetical protein
MDTQNIIANVMEQQLMNAAQVMESQVDAEMDKLDKYDEDDFEKLRQKRMAALKKKEEQRREWLQIGHGKYEEIPAEKDFFDVCKKSPRVVCHFYRESAFRCKIVDKHMAILAQKHVETRFVKIDAEKCPFLTQRLKIKVIPTLCLSRDAKTVDYIVGFDDLGGVDDFPTEMLEWRIGRSECLYYSGDLMTPPMVSKDKKLNFIAKKEKTIRQSGEDSSDDEDDW